VSIKFRLSKKGMSICVNPSVMKPSHVEVRLIPAQQPNAAICTYVPVGLRVYHSITAYIRTENTCVRICHVLTARRMNDVT
jgi:ribosomal protein S12